MGNQTMKNYPIIKSNEAVTALFTAPRHGYVLDYNDDHYADVLCKSDWSEGAFSNVEGNWFKGKCIVVDNDDERDFVRKLIFNISGVLFSEPSVSNAKVFYVEGCCWCHTDFIYDQTLESKKQLHIPFNEIFNDTTVTTELKGAPPSPSVKDRYRACVKLMNDLLAENERNNGNCILNEKQVWLINELINTSQLLIDQKSDSESIVDDDLRKRIDDLVFSLDYKDKQIKELLSKCNAQSAAVSVWKNYEKRIEAAIGEGHQNGAIGFAADFIELANELLPTDQPLVEQFKQVVANLNANKAPLTPLVEWKETHEVKIGDTWFQVEPVFVSEVEMFFYDPKPTPPAIAPTNSVRQSNLSVININSPDYRNNEIGCLCIDDDGVLHPYDPESGVPVVKLCKNIL